jgi:hypothetical protein
MHYSVLVAVALGARRCELSQQLRPEKSTARALLVLGGCCHDYKAEGHSGGGHCRAGAMSRRRPTRYDDHAPEPGLCREPNWAEGFDVVIHDSVRQRQGPGGD